MGKNQDECLAACNDQINNVGVTSSQFPNRETFVKREEFCITFMKLNRTCASAKRPFLTNKFPNGEFKKNNNFPLHKFPFSQVRFKNLLKSMLALKIFKMVI